MDFKALEYICAISEAQTISQAAKNLFISQPALSQYLSKVEQELGTPLFVRTGSTMTLTSAGAIVVREGRALLTAARNWWGRLPASPADGRKRYALAFRRFTANIIFRYCCPITERTTLTSG